MSSEHKEFGPGWETVPDKVRELAEAAGLLDELADPDTEAMYNKTRLGICMTCNSELGDNAMLLINQSGLGAAYCGGPCLQDLALVGWLGEQHDDVIQRIDFRGGRSDG